MRARSVSLFLVVVLLGLLVRLPFLAEVHEPFMFPALPFLLLAMLDRSGTGNRNELRGAWLLLSLTFSFNLLTIASPFPALAPRGWPQLWTNLVATTADTPLLSALRGLALAAAAVNLVVFVRLLKLLVRR